MGKQYVRLSDFKGNDLPGVGVGLHSYNNYRVFFMKEFLSVVSVLGREKGDEMRILIESQADSMPYVHPYEFVINELYYEFRLRYKLYEYPEKEILDQWCKIVIEDRGTDAGLDFYNLIVKFRAIRFELFPSILYRTPI